MKVIEPGHIYQLQHLDGSGAGILVFVNREAGTEHEGVQTQEVLRALIDRTKHCDSCLRWEGNDKIIEHLRMALVLHETRALERKVEKGVFTPETVATAPDGHFKLEVGGKTYDANKVTAPDFVANALGPPMTTDYCATCGQSPDSSIHVLGVGSHTYEDPRWRHGSDTKWHSGDAKFYGEVSGRPLAGPPMRCNVPMCGDSGLCEACRARGAR